MMSGDHSPPPRLRADAVRNRALVLAAAESVFAEEGANAQLLDIAKRAGVGAGTVHRHFATKDALLTEVLATRLNDLLIQANALSVEYDPGEAFFKFWTRATELAYRNTAICEAFTTSSGEELRVPDELRERFLKTLDDMLNAAKTTGAVRHDIDVLDAVALLSAGVLAEQHRSGRLPDRTAVRSCRQCPAPRSACRSERRLTPVPAPHASVLPLSLAAVAEQQPRRLLV